MSSSLTSSAFTSTVFISATASFTASSFLPFCTSAGFFTSAFSVSFTSVCFADFFGLVEESILSRSILSSTFGVSSSGALTFVNVEAGTSASLTSSFISSFTISFTGSITWAATVSAGFSSSTGFGFGSFLVKERSCSSFFFLGSFAAAPLGRSICIAFSCATLSC